MVSDIFYLTWSKNWYKPYHITHYDMNIILWHVKFCHSLQRTLYDNNVHETAAANKDEVECQNE